MRTVGLPFFFCGNCILYPPAQRFLFRLLTFYWSFPRIHAGEEKASFAFSFIGFAEEQHNKKAQPANGKQKSVSGMR
jgi:hypothetical protein